MPGEGSEDVNPGGLPSLFQATLDMELLSNRSLLNPHNFDLSSCMLLVLSCLMEAVATVKFWVTGTTIG